MSSSRKKAPAQAQWFKRVANRPLSQTSSAGASKQNISNPQSPKIHKNWPDEEHLRRRIRREFAEDPYIPNAKPKAWATVPEALLDIFRTNVADHDKLWYHCGSLGPAPHSFQPIKKRVPEEAVGQLGVELMDDLQVVDDDDDE